MNNKSSISLAAMFFLLLGISLYEMAQISTGQLPLQLGWSWYVAFLVSAVGLLVIARDAK